MPKPYFAWIYCILMTNDWYTPARAVATTVRSTSTIEVSSSDTKRSTPHTAVRTASRSMSSDEKFCALRNGTQFGPDLGVSSRCGSLVRRRYRHQINTPVKAESKVTRLAVPAESEFVSW